MSKVYKGHRMSGGTIVTVTDESGAPHRLPLRLEVRNHSPSGFNWGYGGSGPAQLALAILVDHFGGVAPDGDIERAERLYQRFKFAVIGKLPEESWELTSERIEAVVAELEKGAAA